MQNNTPHLNRVILLTTVAALGGFLFGYDSGVINGTVSAIQKAFGANDVASGFNVASMLLGCAAGAFFAGRIADRFGRKTALFTAAILFGISAWGSGIVDNSMAFVIYRLIGGFAVGAASVISPAYISEIAPSNMRGRLSTLQQMAIVLGLFFAFLANYLIANASGGASEVFLWGFQAWQFMFWMELIPVALFLLGLFFIPESPRYLVAIGKSEQAEAVLASISHADDAKAKVAEIRHTLITDHRPSLRDLWDDVGRRIKPIVWVGVGLAALQQLIGINVVFYYGEVLWKAAGFSEANALLINVIGGLINVGATLGSLLLVDKWGRKPLLMLGAGIMAFFLIILTFVFAMAETGDGGNLALSNVEGVIALCAANLFLVGFGLSWGPVVWVLLGEMFSNQIRGAAISIAGLTIWVSNFIVTMTFPILLENIGLGGAYSIYAAFAVLAWFFSWKIVKETKGKTLEQM